MRIIGIDPGLRNLGWGVIEGERGRFRHVANGTIRSASGELAPRLLSLHEKLTEVFARFAPDTAAVEQTFVNKDAVATLKLGQARAIALLVPAQFGIEIGEYAPNKVKKTVVGAGHADKAQIQYMIKLQLPSATLDSPDAADALAIALCHGHYHGAQELKVRA
ncbi:crossover junction endodeoxyribonuclease RuvC [Pacificoceanicola onchidii]|uniref:crossover junction endodeoxyribonuclease RuvC n=1 Tax=Pacificoceanicola onchidii TaxID=2562685 RepID=UPI0010A33831|nr:crossover junction endodeoxyribonuclease RuvC [Pacificoceanicola onchidii]